MQSGHKVVACVVICSGILASCRPARAAVTNASVFEQVDASTLVPAPGGNVALDDNHTNLVLPPINLSAESENVNTGAMATITINKYTGPLTATDSTGGLDLNVSLAATASAIAPALASSLAGFSGYTFTLTASQPYTYSTTGTLAVTTFTGTGGAISPGSGTLLPGQYTISSNLQGSSEIEFSGEAFHLQVAAVPEPGAVALLGVVLVGAARRRRA